MPNDNPSIDETLIRNLCQEGCFSFPDDFTINFSKNDLSISANATFKKEVIDDKEYLQVFTLLNIQHGMKQISEILTFQQPLSFQADSGASHWFYLSADAPSAINAQTSGSSFASAHGLFASKEDPAENGLDPEVSVNALHPNFSQSQ